MSTRIAVAGYGRFGNRHARVVDAYPGAVLAAIAEPKEDARTRASATHPDALVYVDPIEMLHVVRPDAVLIVSPEDTHAPIAEAAIEQGTHVFSEKPLATELTQARRLVSAANSAGVVYQAGYILRYEPRHALLAGRVAAGDFGTLASARLKRNCSRTWFEAYGSRVHPVYETLVHDLDTLLWLAGERCTRVTSWERNTLGAEVCDTLLLVAEFGSGLTATLDTSWLVPEGASANIVGWGEGGGAGNGVIDASLELVGTDASATLSTYEPSLTITSRSHTSLPDAVLWPEVGGQVAGALRDEIVDFINRASGDPGAGVASLADALHVQEIADAAVRSGATGEPVELPGTEQV